MIRSWFRKSGLWLLVVTATSLPAQRGGGGGGAIGIQTPTTADLTVHGSVTLPDSVIPERLVRIEKLCGGRVEATTYADSKGRFAFDLGMVDRGTAGGAATTSVNAAALASVVPTGKVITARDMKDCSVRVSLAGYHPQTLPLEPVVKDEKTTLGELMFQPLGKQETALLSATDSTVPMNARKDYEKGLDEAAKSKWKDAIGAMQKAASVYPKFATAWLSLGMLQSGEKDAGAALKSFAQAIAADDRFAPPYVESAVLEADAGQWAKVIEQTNKAISLAPDSLAGAYYLNAMANVRLNQGDAALKSVAEGLKVDQDHEYPDLEYIDGVLLMTKGDAEAARKQFESYLGIAPNGTNATTAQKLLNELSPKK
jgi:tetratricopeptide (TPR) repeat protein